MHALGKGTDVGCARGCTRVLAFQRFAFFSGCTALPSGAAGGAACASEGLSKTIRVLCFSLLLTCPGGVQTQISGGGVVKPKSSSIETGRAGGGTPGLLSASACWDRERKQIRSSSLYSAPEAAPELAKRSSQIVSVSARWPQDVIENCYVVLIATWQQSLMSAEIETWQTLKALPYLFSP